MRKPDDLGFWRRVETIRLGDAVSLTLGIDPNWTDGTYDLPSHWDKGFKPVLAILVQAILSGELPAQVMYPCYDDYWRKTTNRSTNNMEALRSVPGFDSEKIVVSETKLKMQDFVGYLHKSRLNNLFLTDEPAAPDAFYEKHHPSYSNKLDAAVACWKALVAQPDLVRGTSVKRAAVRWLQDNAAAFDLINSEGKVVAKAVDEIACVVNWDQKGGAPKTP